MMATCYLMLGSNLGDRKRYLETAINSIEKDIGKIEKKSSIYESESWGYDDPSAYYNQALAVDSQLEPIELLEKCLAIENELGRKRSKKQYQSRTIDIDLLFYGGIILTSEKLTLPHPHIASRRFVLEPLSEICPELIHPVTYKSIKELLDTCEDKYFVQKLEFE